MLRQLEPVEHMKVEFEKLQLQTDPLRQELRGVNSLITNYEHLNELVEEIRIVIQKVKNLI